MHNKMGTRRSKEARTMMTWLCGGGDGAIVPPRRRRRRQQQPRPQQSPFALILLVVVIVTIICTAASSSGSSTVLVNGFLLTPTISRRTTSFLSRRRISAPCRCFSDIRCPSTTIRRSGVILQQKSDKAGGERGGGGGKNWIEKDSPSGTSKPSDESSTLVDEYSLGIDGKEFQIGPLTSKFYNALLSSAQERFGGNVDNIPSEILPVYKAYAMDLSAKEATKVALDTNGLELMADAAALDKESGMPGAWGIIEDVELDDESGETFDTIQHAVDSGKWQPGMSFSFVVRGVRAGLKTMDFKTLLKQLDLGVDFMDDEDDGEDEDDYDNDNDDESSTSPPPKLKGLSPSYKPMQITSLQTMAQDMENKCNALPRSAAAVGFAGGTGTGYDVIPRQSLRDDDGTTLLNPNQVRTTLQQHGFMVIDLGENTLETEYMHGMWDTTNQFFDLANNRPEGQGRPNIPGMSTAKQAGTKYAAAGFAEYQDGAMQFLETRTIRRDDGKSGEQRTLVPDGINELFGKHGVEQLTLSQDVITDVGKDISSLALQGVFVSNENDNDDDDDEGCVGNSDVGVTIPREAADRLIRDILDDGKVLDGLDDTPINMSPHRMCRYTDVGGKKEGSKKESSSASASAREIFGAHTDTSFMTLVPVAQVSGLEVYDMSLETWVRPERLARQHWENEQLDRGNVDLSEGSKHPWHCRYIVAMPGELLQIITGNAVQAVPHRVVAVTGGGPSRLSAPVLLRARFRAKFDVSRYYSDVSSGQLPPLLLDANGKTMEQVHDALQPGRF